MSNPKIQLLNQDCLALMPSISTNSVSLIIADYPFNCQDHRKNYIRFVKETAEQFERITKDVANLVVINNPINMYRTVKLFEDKWDIVNGIALIRKGSLRSAYHWGFQHNYCLVLNKGGIKNKWHGTKVNHDKGFATDVMNYQNGYRGKGKDWHPQAIPYNLTEHFVKILSDEGDLVFDPFTGSGTTALVCEDSNRYFIGCEYHKKYYDMALRRIENNRRKNP